MWTPFSTSEFGPAVVQKSCAELRGPSSYGEHEVGRERAAREVGNVHAGTAAAVAYRETLDRETPGLCVAIEK